MLIENVWWRYQIIIFFLLSDMKSPPQKMNVFEMTKNFQKFFSRKHIINMTSDMKNQLTKLYDVVSASVTATRDGLAERLQSARETASWLYIRMIENMKYGRERLKGIVEKEAEGRATARKRHRFNTTWTWKRIKRSMQKFCDTCCTWNRYR